MSQKGSQGSNLVKALIQSLHTVSVLVQDATRKIKETKGIILHSDQGWQYQNKKYQKLLKEKGIEAEFWLVGEPDKQNRTSLSLDKLQYYHQQGYVRYLGFQTNIKKIWQQAHVAVLPSYREGLSHALLEAGAYGRAIITTDAPGGRELIKDKNNGLLVKVKDHKSLANAMELLVVDNSLRKKLGNQIRQDIANLYDTAIIQNKMIDHAKLVFKSFL